MTWVRLDDGFTEHPTIDALSAEAFKLHVAGLCYSARNLTDGIVPTLAALRLTATARKGHLGELEAAGLWQCTDGGWEIRNFLEFNPSKEAVERDREQARERMRRVRANKNRTSPEVPAQFDRSSGTPSRPDPSIELSSSSEEPQAVDNRNEDERIQPALELVATHRSAGKNGRYRTTVLTNLRAEENLDVDAARRLTEYPDLTVAQLADVLQGNTTVLATARRSTMGDNGSC